MRVAKQLVQNTLFSPQTPVSVCQPQKEAPAHAECRWPVCEATAWATMAWQAGRNICRFDCHMQTVLACTLLVKGISTFA